MKKEIELIDDGKQNHRFKKLTKHLVSVSKVEIDRRLEQEREAKEAQTDKKRKA